MDCIDILCINCESLIPPSSIDDHSKTCTKSLTPQFSPSEDELLSINQKLIKLKTVLERFTTSKSLKPIQKEVAYFLIRQCAEVQSIKSVSLENLNLCLCINEGLKAYSRLPISELFLLVNHERLKVCAKSKARVMLELIRKEPAEKTSFLFENFDTNDLSKITEEKDSRRETEIENFQLSNIQSALFSKNASNLSNVYSSTSSFADVCNSFTNLSQDELKKCFYSKCLQVKFRNNVEGRKSLIQISELYKKTVEIGIRPEKWDEFIQNSLIQEGSGLD